MGDKIDFNLLAIVLNAGVSVILLGGLIFGINTAQLIMIGVLGYGMSILFRRIKQVLHQKRNPLRDVNYIPH